MDKKDMNKQSKNFSKTYKMNTTWAKLDTMFYRSCPYSNLFWSTHTHTHKNLITVLQGFAQRAFVHSTELSFWLLLVRHSITAADLALCETLRHSLWLLSDMLVWRCIIQSTQPYAPTNIKWLRREAANTVWDANRCRNSSAVRTLGRVPIHICNL